MKTLVGALALLIVIGGGCAASPSRTAKETDRVPLGARLTSAAQDYSAAIAPNGEALSVELRAPKRVRWVSATLAPARPTLGVFVTNRGAASADVSNLRVQLEASREGVSFPCTVPSVGAAPGIREPASLAPGASFLFERALDCSLPLAGSYAVSVSVSFGHQGPWASPRAIRTFALNVHAPTELEPKPIDALPGVWGAVGASNVLEGEPGRGGSGRIAVLLVNGGSLIVPVPRLRLALRVYRSGSRIPCEDAPVTLHLPKSNVLEPGAAFREAIEVSCLGLSTPGKYEIAARLLVGEDDSNEIELGRLRIEISNDPSRLGSPTIVR